MKILKDLIEKANDTLEEVEWYGEKAILLREEHRNIADTYNKIAETHITIYDMLHKQMVDIIELKKREGIQPPNEMIAIWNYEHEKLIKEFKEAKLLVDEYKKY